MRNSWVARVMVAGGIKFSHAVIKISLDAGESAAGSDEVTKSCSHHLFKTLPDLGFATLLCSNSEQQDC